MTTLGGGVIGGTVFVMRVLQSRQYRGMPVALALLTVVAQVSSIEGVFALLYSSLSAHFAQAFSSPLTSVDALYFTISTATSTGMGDIHPVSSIARLLVSAQMVVSLALIFAAITTAVQRFFRHDE